MLEKAADVFQPYGAEPRRLGPGWRVVNIQIGCYRTNAPNRYELRMTVLGIEGAEVVECYTSGDPNTPRFSAANAFANVRQRILKEYPLQGKCNPGMGLVTLNIGRLAGVRQYDRFKILSPNELGRVVGAGRGYLEVVDEPEEEKSTAKLELPLEEIDEQHSIKLVLDPNATDQVCP
jgi:hypothetical protein